MDSTNIIQRRRVSSIPKLPDQDTYSDVITMPPTSLMSDHEKTLPPLPINTNKNDDIQSNSSSDSSVSNNKSSIGLGTSLKSGPIVSATPTNVSSSDGFRSSTDLALDTQLQQLQGSDKELNGKSEIENSDPGVMGTLMKNFTSYGQNKSQNTCDKENITSSMTYSNTKIDENSLGEGIHFESEKGTEMLTYRKSRGKSNNPLKVDTGGVKTPTHTRNTSVGTTFASEHLKSTVLSPQTSISSNFGTTPVTLPTTPKVEVDYNNYVDEKYLDTQYRYATEKRNEEFHQLFLDVPQTDRLLDDFSCALSREILLQGRLYVSEHYLCFNSSLLGWVTTFVVSLDEIQRFERRSTVGLFPNGIIIETREAKHIFASFITRDQTLNFLETVWSKSISLSKKNHEKSREFESMQSKTSFEGVNENVKLLSESDIYTIDGDSSSDAAHDDFGEDYEDESSIAADDDDDDDDDTLDNTNPKIKDKTELKSKTRMNTFLGPKKHEPSRFSFDYKSENETIVLEKSYDVPIGVIFGICFGDSIDFHKKMMVLNDGLNFTDYDVIKNEGDERVFEYDKNLNFPIGPSSTRVYCTDTIEHLDYENYINIINISKTPNVPSGNAFFCKTRYIFKWDENNQTKLTISFKVVWTGSSWFKGTIESSVLSGQKKVASDFDNELLKIIPQKIIELDLTNDSDNEITFANKEKNKPVQTPSESIQNITTQVKQPIVVDNELFAKQVIKTPLGKIRLLDIIFTLFAIILIELILLVYVSTKIASTNTILNAQLKLIAGLSVRLGELERD